MERRKSKIATARAVREAKGDMSLQGDISPSDCFYQSLIPSVKPKIRLNSTHSTHTQPEEKQRKRPFTVDGRNSGNTNSQTEINEERGIKREGKV